LSVDDGTQCEEDLLMLLNLLKNKYLFHDEMNKNILYDHEIHRFAELYNITNFCSVLACYDLIFWLKDLNSTIYMWSHTDKLMILRGHNMKETLINFLFHQKNLCYIEKYTHELMSVKEVKDEADKWYKENKKAAIKIVITDELLKILEEKKNKKRMRNKKKKKK